MSSPVRSTHFQNLAGTVTNITNGRCEIVEITAVNTSGAVAFIQIFDLAAADVVLGTTVPMFVIPVAATSGFEVVYFGVNGWYVETRLSAASTTTAEGSTGSASGVFLQAFVN